MDREKEPAPVLRPAELREHLRLVDASTSDERDELLTDILVHTYASRAAQDC